MASRPETVPSTYTDPSDVHYDPSSPSALASSSKCSSPAQITVILISVLVVLGVTIGLVLHFTKGQDDNPDADATLRQSFAQASFPNGSYAQDKSAFGQAGAAVAPLTMDQFVLMNASIAVDPSSLVAQGGRPQYFYFRLPNNVAIQDGGGNERRSRLLAALARVPLRSDDHVPLTAPMWISSEENGGHPTVMVGEEDPVIGFGVSFGSGSGGEPVIVIPFTNALGLPTKGLGQVGTHRQDGSRVFALSFTPPAAMCLAGAPASCASVPTQSYTVTAAGKLSPGVGGNIPAACGPPCQLAGTMCAASCQTCSKDTVAGADTPVSRNYDLGSAIGSVRFEYNTVNVKDQMVVWNGNQVIFDSGCVGTGGRVGLSLPIHARDVRVDVHPNCACASSTGFCTGTLWDFTVSCPEYTLDQTGVDLIKGFEGWRPCYYVDPVGLPTIGYGHLIKSGDPWGPGDCLTVSEGEALLQSDAQQFVTCVNAMGLNINQNQFNAIVSFAYNLGCGSSGVASVATAIRSADYAGVCDIMKQYVRGGGQVLPGLVNRRAAECNLFNS